MKKVISIFLALALTGAAASAAIPRKVNMQFLQPRDSLLIGDQIKYTLPLGEVTDGSWVELPRLDTQLCNYVDVIGEWVKDTVAVNASEGTKTIDASIKLASYDEGEYLLPDLPVVLHRPGGLCDTLVFQGEDILVCTIPLDSTFVMHDIRPQAVLQLSVMDKLGMFFENHPSLKWVLLGLLVAAVIAVAVWLAIHFTRRKVKAQAQDPAHVVALRKLDQYRGEKFWAAPRQKQFYSGVTDTIREYIISRYGIPAMEMTSSEIFAALKKTDVPEDVKKELQDLFERADFVKFAKYEATEKENSLVVPVAVKFVVSTYQQEIKEEVEDVL